MINRIQYCARRYSTIPFQMSDRGSRSLQSHRLLKFLKCKGEDQNEDIEEIPIEDEISLIVDELIRIDKDNGDLSNLNPRVLIDFAFVLCKGNHYEAVMEEKMKNTASVAESKQLERIDALLNGFIISERKNRARVKMNYILAGATTGRLEESINLLVERYGIHLLNL